MEMAERKLRILSGAPLVKEEVLLFSLKVSSVPWSAVTAGLLTVNSWSLADLSLCSACYSNYQGVSGGDEWLETAERFILPERSKKNKNKEKEVLLHCKYKVSSTLPLYSFVLLFCRLVVQTVESSNILNLNLLVTSCFV